MAGDLAGDKLALVEPFRIYWINIYSIYLKADIFKKREIIGSIFHEKMRFDGTQHRTAKLSGADSLIYLINNEFKKQKNGAKIPFKDFAP